MGREYIGENTRNAMADTLLALVQAGRPLPGITVKEITDAHNLNRQAFYYHFGNIYELARFTFDREVMRMFEVDELDAIYAIDWKERILRVLSLLEDTNSPLRAVIQTSLGEETVHKALLEIIKDEVRRDFLPQLEVLGLEETEIGRRVDIISYLLAVILMDWITGKIHGSCEGILATIEEMLGDYLSGLKARLSSGPSYPLSLCQTSYNES